MKEKQGIYKITNKINNKVYIGQSINIEQRWGQHKRNAFNENCHTYNYPLYRAIRKYGIENFTFEIIEECSSEILTVKEQQWIDYYNSLNSQYGYNIVPAIDSKKGENCNWAMLTNQQFDIIVSLLKETNILMTDIGKMFNVSGSCIEDINKGRRRHQDNIDYPIRKNSRSNAHQGERQNTAILTTTDVMIIRNRYVNEEMKDIYEDYKDKISYSQMKKICYGSAWKHLPCYKKRLKTWILESNL